VKKCVKEFLTSQVVIQAVADRRAVKKSEGELSQPGLPHLAAGQQITNLFKSSFSGERAWALSGSASP
jgi:hypothetical protein